MSYRGVGDADGIPFRYHAITNDQQAQIDLWNALTPAEQRRIVAVSRAGRPWPRFQGPWLNPAVAVGDDAAPPRAEQCGRSTYEGLVILAGVLGVLVVLPKAFAWGRKGAK